MRTQKPAELTTQEIIDSSPPRKMPKIDRNPIPIDLNQTIHENDFDDSWSPKSLHELTQAPELTEQTQQTQENNTQDNLAISNLEMLKLKETAANQHTVRVVL